MGERGSYKVLVGKPEGKRPLARLRDRWQDNIKMDVQDEQTWTELVWLRIGANSGLL